MPLSTGLSAAKGQIDLKWLHEADGRLILCWTEMGGPAVPVQTPMRQGFGSRVIERMIGQLKGKRVSTGVRKGLFAKSPFKREINPSLASSRPGHLPVTSRCQVTP